jgi:probable rRNA maturation factor
MSAVSLDIARNVDAWDGLPEAEALAERALEEAASRAGVQLRPNAEVSLLLTGDMEIRGINKEWRGKDKPTNVLSFPAVPPEKLARAPFLGDIAMAFETIEREAAADGKLLADHFSHLVVHGFLHLVGYDHETEAEAEAMESLETKILAALGIGDPYAEDDSAGPGAAPLDGARRRGRMTEGP